MVLTPGPTYLASEGIKLPCSLSYWRSYCGKGMLSRACLSFHADHIIWFECHIHGHSQENMA